MATVRILKDSKEMYEGITDVVVRLPEEYCNLDKELSKSKADPELLVGPVTVTLKNGQTGEEKSITVDIENWLSVKVTGDVKSLACGRATVYGNVRKLMALAYAKCSGAVNKLIQFEENVAEVHDLKEADFGIVTLEETATEQGYNIGEPTVIDITGELESLDVCTVGCSSEVSVTADITVNGSVTNANVSNVVCVDGDVEEVVGGKYDHHILYLSSKPKDIVNVNSSCVEYLDCTDVWRCTCEGGHDLMWDIRRVPMNKIKDVG